MISVTTQYVNGREKALLTGKDSSRIRDYAIVPLKHTTFKAGLIVGKHDTVTLSAESIILNETSNDGKASFCDEKALQPAMQKIDFSPNEVRRISLDNGLNQQESEDTEKTLCTLKKRFQASVASKIGQDISAVLKILSRISISSVEADLQLDQLTDTKQEFLKKPAITTSYQMDHEESPNPTGRYVYHSKVSEEMLASLAKSGIANGNTTKELEVFLSGSCLNSPEKDLLGSGSLSVAKLVKSLLFKKPDAIDENLHTCST